MKKIQQYGIWILIVVFPLLFTTLSLDPDIYIRFIGLSVFLVFVAIYFILNARTIKAGYDKLFFFYLAFVLYSLISAFLARNIADGIFDWLKILSGFLLFFLFTILLSGKPKPESEIVKAFTILCFILSIAGFINLFIILLQGNLIIPLSTYQVAPFFGHRNLYCQMLFFAFPFTLISSFYGKKGFWKVMGICSFIIAVFVLIVLSNRATWLALAGGFAAVVFFHILWFKKFRIDLVGKVFKKRWLYLAPLIILICSTLFYLKYADIGSLEKHTAGIVEFDKGSTKDRMELWKRTVELIKEKPVFGVGLSNWKIEMLKLGNKGLVSEDNNTFYQRPHNDFLWIACESGLIGLLLYCSIFIIAIFYLFRILKKCSSYEDFLFYNMILVVGAGFLVYSFFSFPKERIESLIVTSVMLGLIVNRHHEITGGRVFATGKLRVFLLFIIVLLPALIFIGSKRFYSDYHMKKALIAKDKKNYTTVIKEIDQAISPYYPTDPFSTPLTWYRGSARFNMNNTDLALKDFKAAYEINPYHIHVLNNLASAYELKGDHKNALKFYKEALAIAPNFEDAWFNLCAVYFNLGQTDSAYQALTHIDTGTKNPKYDKYLAVVLNARFSEMANSKPALRKWVNLFNSDQIKYTKVHQYAVDHKVEIFSIFTDTLLLRSIYTQ